MCNYVAYNQRPVTYLFLAHLCIQPSFIHVVLFCFTFLYRYLRCVRCLIVLEICLVSWLRHTVPVSWFLCPIAVQCKPWLSIAVARQRRMLTEWSADDRRSFIINRFFSARWSTSPVFRALSVGCPLRDPAGTHRWSSECNVTVPSWDGHWAAGSK